MKTDPRKKKERKKNIKGKRENKYTELSFQWGEGRPIRTGQYPLVRITTEKTAQISQKE